MWSDARPLGGDTSGFHIEGSGGLLVNQGVRAGNQTQPAIATLRDGRIIVVWTDPGADATGGDSSGNSVRARIFDPRTNAVALAGSALDDDFVGTAFDDVMNGQDGSDRIDGAGGKDTIGGGASNDALLGGSGDDNLLGGDGIDRLNGGAGKDLLTGGGDADTFVFDLKPSKKTNVDRITDFKPGLDAIVLDQSIFRKLKPGELNPKAFYARRNADKANDGKDRVIYDTKSGETYWDKDGKGGAKAKLFAILDGAPDIDAGDVLVVA